MRPRTPAWLAILGVAAGIGGAAALLHARDTRYPEPPQTDRLLYLRSGRTADRVMLTFDSLAADVYWIRAIQHYGRDVAAERRGRPRQDSFGLLQPLLDLTTTLDPHFNVAYRFGSLFLAMQPPDGPGRVDQAIALLEKGLKVNPDRWQYAYDLGFIHYWHTGDFQEAARWFEKAAAMPDAPEWIQPFLAVTLVQGGQRQRAWEMLTQLEQSPERYIRRAAERGKAQLLALQAIDDLQAAVERYHETTGQYPASLSQLPELRGQLPVDVSRTPFAYDPSTHQVSLGPGSPLAPLPAAMSR
jgi:tetratricopeptide (TPR) repeat protein